MKRLSLERLLAGILALIATYAFFFEYLPPFKRVHLFSDLEVYHYPLQRYVFQALKEWRLPQWDPSMYCGISFVGNLQSALFYPPSWLIYAANWQREILPFKPMEYFIFAHVWLAFLMCYMWLRARRLDWFSSTMGATVFAFGGYMLWQVVHLGVAVALPWMPLAFWGIDQAVERRQWLALWRTAIASAMWFLAGYPPSWLAYCVTVVLYALASSERLRAAAAVSLAIAASLVLAMVQLLPTLEVQPSMFSEPRYTGLQHNPIIPLFVANWVDQSRTSSLHYLKVIYLYWGVAAIFAMLWAISRRKVRPYAQPLIVIAVCLFLVIDPYAIVYWTIVWIPLLESTAQAYNFYEGIAAMAALITALGISDFLERGSKRAVPRWLLPVTIAAAAGWTAFQLRSWLQGGVFPTGGRAVAATVTVLGIFGLALWTLRAQLGRRRVLVAVMVILFVLCDYKVYGTNRLFNTRDGDVDESIKTRGISGIDDAAYQAMWTNRHYRVTSDGSPAAVEFRMWSLATPQGLDPFLTKRYRELVQPWAHFQTSRVFLVDYRNTAMLELLGVRYAITYRGAPSFPFLTESPDFRLVGSPDSFYRVYEYLHARPPYGWERGAGDTQLVEWMPERRTFRVNSDQGGRFTLVEQVLPGWRATIDGRPVPIERWHSVFQSISAPPGTHTVVFEFHSRLLPWGAAISLFAWCGLLWVIGSDRRRSNSPHERSLHAAPRPPGS